MDWRLMSVLVILGSNLWYLAESVFLHGQPRGNYHGGWALFGVIITLLLYWGAGLFEVFE